MTINPDSKTEACKDCVSEYGHSNRPVHTDGRCFTHYRSRTKHKKDVRHEWHVATEYGLKGGEYQQLFEDCDGRCRICTRALGRLSGFGTAKKKWPPVDHDHQTGLARGVLCSRCNRYLAWIQDNPGAGIRIHDYLLDPPALRLLGRRYAKGFRDED